MEWPSIRLKMKDKKITRINRFSMVWWPKNNSTKEVLKAFWRVSNTLKSISHDSTDNLDIWFLMARKELIASMILHRNPTWTPNSFPTLRDYVASRYVGSWLVYLLPRNIREPIVGDLIEDNIDLLEGSTPQGLVKLIMLAKIMFTGFVLLKTRLIDLLPLPNKSN